MIKIFIDAATHSDKQLSAGGMVLVQQQTQSQHYVPLAATDNHNAEFEILIFALSYCLSHHLNTDTILIYSDSKIVVQTIEKNYAKNSSFKAYLTEINHLLSQFHFVLIEWIPEAKNKGADQLAKQGLQRQLKSRKLDK